MLNHQFLGLHNSFSRKSIFLCRMLTKNHTAKRLRMIKINSDQQLSCEPTKNQRSPNQTGRLRAGAHFSGFSPSALLIARETPGARCIAHKAQHVCCAFAIVTTKQSQAPFQITTAVYKPSKQYCVMDLPQVSEQTRLALYCTDLSEQCCCFFDLPIV